MFSFLVYKIFASLLNVVIFIWQSLTSFICSWIYNFQK
ncbi:hypothetical protein CoNPh26_CDS0082 [Staphylococcus phage S-CoN_Ph26]|nr:hypothetical protein CoNPh26_CDS0082 [Staphylococcus phage S-CoN_Ph26]